MSLPRKSTTEASKSITVFQALLILIDKYQKQPTSLINADHLKKLKKLSFLGARNEKEHAEMKSYLKDPDLSDFQITSDHVAINQDPSRRYFETHFSSFLAFYFI